MVLSRRAGHVGGAGFTEEILRYLSRITPTCGGTTSQCSPMRKWSAKPASGDPEVLGYVTKIPLEAGDMLHNPPPPMRKRSTGQGLADAIFRRGPVLQGSRLQAGGMLLKFPIQKAFYRKRTGIVWDSRRVPTLQGSRYGRGKCCPICPHKKTSYQTRNGES